MRATIHLSALEHQQRYGAAIKRGLERHGIAVDSVPIGEFKPSDFAAIWGFGPHHGPVIEAAPHVLVMEGAHVDGGPDRLAYCSLGWDGLAGRGRYARAEDGGARWRQRYGSLMRPWRHGGHYTLLLGQVPADAALRGLNIERWLETMRAWLTALGHQVRVRPHPLVARGRALAEDLEEAALAVTYNSTAAIEAVLAGVPTVTIDRGSMAWPVTSHDPAGKAIRPDREAWAADLAWSQWAIGEIESGDFWIHLSNVMEA